MQYVPSIPPPGKEPERDNEVKGLSPAQPVKPIQPRTRPPLIMRGIHPGDHGQAGHTEEPTVGEKRFLEERRKFCRRTEHQWVLIDLRAPHDRRHKSQRQTDLSTNVDEEA